MKHSISLILSCIKEVFLFTQNRREVTNMSYVICNNDNYEEYGIEAENEKDAKDLAI